MTAESGASPARPLSPLLPPPSPPRRATSPPRLPLPLLSVDAPTLIDQGESSYEDEDDPLLPGCTNLRCDGSFWELYEELRVLGRGYFGTVLLARERATGRMAAVKVVSKAESGRRASYADIDCRREVQVLLGLPAHAHVVQLLGTYQSPATLFVLFEPELGGDLLSRLEALPGHVLPEAEARRHAAQLLSAVAHLHAEGVVHRDIKPSNVLLSRDCRSLRLADFGLSERLPAAGLLTSVCGTHDYLAPEMVLCGHGEAEGYGLAVDMWGVGLLLWTLLFGQNPFERPTEIETLQAILSAEMSFPADSAVSEEARDLLRRLLVADVEQRLTASQALEHPWVAAALEETVKPPAAEACKAVCKVENALECFSPAFSRISRVSLRSRLLSARSLRRR